jgi:hypothetical protein
MTAHYLYMRMQEIPSLVFTDDYLQIKRSIIQFLWKKNWTGIKTMSFHKVSFYYIIMQKIIILLKNIQKNFQNINLVNIRKNEYFIKSSCKIKIPMYNLVIL